VENVKSPLNLALAAELRAERVAINMTIEELRERAGITKPTMLAMNITAEDLFRRAVDRMGGMGALMSEAPTNNVHVLKSVDTLDTGELDAAVAQAALRDDEMNQSEHYQ
jgi:hypothetical protein